MIGLGDAHLFLIVDGSGISGVADLTSGLGEVRFIKGGVWYGHSPVPRADKATQQRHGWRFNTGFVDCHIETLRPADLWDTSNDQVLKRWNKDNLPHRDLARPDTKWTP